MAESGRAPLIIGAGPAGLTAALKLAERGVTARLFEATEHVGGLARTPSAGEWRVDPGGHRFFTRNEEVQKLWRSLLPTDQWTSVPRRSAMLIHGHYVRYPLVGRELVTQMGIRSGIRGIGSLLWSKMRDGRHVASGPTNFREWGTHKFGRYWYDLFFDGYVRKTWLAEPEDLTSDWASQRIRPIGWHARGKFDGRSIDAFQYPRLGPGQLWEAAAAALADRGVVPKLNSRVIRVRREGTDWTVELEDGEFISGDALFSTMPLRVLIETMEPQPPEHIRAAAAHLKHRSLITVAVAIDEPHDIPFNWVYTPGPEFAAGRIQNYRHWSNQLTPDAWNGTFLGLEYFIGPGGALWSASDEQLHTVVAHDLKRLGLGDSAIERFMIVRSQFAYPIYDPAREASVALIRDYLQQQFPTLHPIGRNGMHRYDNQDHAMLSAMSSVARYFGEDVDPWQVNTDSEYHEAGLLHPLKT